MKAKQEVFREQLKHACRLTGASWGGYAVKTLDEWALVWSVNLPVKRMEEITKFLQTRKINDWLDKLGDDRKSGYRSTKGNPNRLDAKRVYAFWTEKSKRILLVGADNLSLLMRNISNL